MNTQIDRQIFLDTNIHLHHICIKQIKIFVSIQIQNVTCIDFLYHIIASMHGVRLFPCDRGMKNILHSARGRVFPVSLSANRARVVNFQLLPLCEKNFSPLCVFSSNGLFQRCVVEFSVLKRTKIPREILSFNISICYYASQQQCFCCFKIPCMLYRSCQQHVNLGSQILSMSCFYINANSDHFAFA